MDPENILEPNELSEEDFSVIDEYTKEYLMRAYNAVLEQDMVQFEDK